MATTPLPKHPVPVKPSPPKPKPAAAPPPPRAAIVEAKHDADIEEPEEPEVDVEDLVAAEAARQAEEEARAFKHVSVTLPITIPAEELTPRVDIGDAPTKLYGGKPYCTVRIVVGGIWEGVIAFTGATEEDAVRNTYKAVVQLGKPRDEARYLDAIDEDGGLFTLQVSPRADVLVFVHDARVRKLLGR